MLPSFNQNNLLKLDSSLPLYNLDVLKATTEDDKEFFIKILSTFLENNTELLEKMRKSLFAKNYLEVGNFAHKMLSSYKHLEVNLLIEPLTKLETLSVGHQMDPNEIQNMVDFLYLHSQELLKRIANEIESAKTN